MAPHQLSPETQAMIDQYGMFITYPTAAEITTASVRTLKRLTASGQLPCYAVGRSKVLRLKTADVANLMVRVA